MIEDRGARALALYLLCGVGVALVALMYFVGVTENPPGFFVAESSIAYSALWVARTGHDEHGVFLPLFFQTYGGYKSPLLVYELAVLYTIFPPSVQVARTLTVALGLSAACVVGLLGWRMTGQRVVGMLLFAIAALTPWLFEMSRVVIESAMLPLATALFLLVLYRCYESRTWTTVTAIIVASALAVVVYSYPTGRVLAPTLAVGLISFLTRDRLRWVIQVWIGLALFLVPYALFELEHQGALSERFEQTTYISPDDSVGEIAWNFAQQYAANLDPRRMLLEGDPNNRHHVQGSLGSFLVAPAALSAAGALCVVLLRRRDPWWRYVLYGALVSPIAVSLTRDELHTLRLSPLLIFLLLLCVPPLAWLLARDTAVRLRRTLLVVALVGTLAQAAAFQWHFRQRGADRQDTFDATFPAALEAARRTGQRPVHLVQVNRSIWYIHAYWYGETVGMRQDDFAFTPSFHDLPPGAVAISDDDEAERCDGCTVLRADHRFSVYVAPHE